MRELLRSVKGLFFRDIDLLQGFEQYIMDSYPEGKNDLHIRILLAQQSKPLPLR